MKFKFEGYEPEDGSEYIEINFDFLEKSEFIKALEPEPEMVVIVPERFPGYSIELFKELLEKMEREEMEEEDENTLNTRIIRPLMEYFRIEYSDFKINLIDISKKFRIEDVLKKKCANIELKIKNSRISLFCEVIYEYMYKATHKKEELIYFGSHGHHVSINEINKMIESLEGGNEPLTYSFGTGLNESYSKILLEVRDKKLSIVSRNCKEELIGSSMYGGLPCKEYVRRKIYEYETKINRPIDFLKSLKEKIIDFIGADRI